MDTVGGLCHCVPDVPHHEHWIMFLFDGAASIVSFHLRYHCVCLFGAFQFVQLKSITAIIVTVDFYTVLD
jgi:hypothetical protein